MHFFSENTFKIQNSLASRYNQHNEVGPPHVYVNPKYHFSVFMVTKKATHIF